MKSKIFSILALFVLLSVVALIGQPRPAPQGSPAKLAPSGVPVETGRTSRNQSNPIVVPSTADKPVTTEVSLEQQATRQPLVDTSTSIVQFANKSARDNFINQNNLTLAKLEPLAADNTYTVALPPSQITLPTGVKTFPNLPYAVALAPNDTLYQDQWHLPKISAPGGWDISTGSSANIIAIIDTGFALDHEDMANRWATNPGESGSTISEGPAPNCTSLGQPLNKQCNNLDDDGNGFIDDWRGWDFAQGDNEPQAGSTNPSGDGVEHGSLTSGAAAATGNNGVGVAGVDWQAKILPLQVLNDNGSGFTSDLADAIDYAAGQGAKVISLSLGGSTADTYLRQRIDAAIAAGVTVVAAAGNCGSTDYFLDPGCDFRGHISEPAAYEPVIAVGATDQNDNRASFSSYGSALDIVAPGVGIVTTSWSASAPTNSYGSASGTSLSTPIVSGMLSLALSVDNTLTPSELKSLITARAQKVAGMGRNIFHDYYGYGRLDNYVTLRVAGGDLPVYRLYQERVHDHLTTISVSERDRAVTNLGFRLEGIVHWSVPSAEPGAVPVYRLYQERVHDHLTTISVSERDRAIANLGFRLEGVAYWAKESNDPGLLPVYRLYQERVHDHLTTISVSERDRAIANLGFRLEGVAYWAKQ